MTEPDPHGEKPADPGITAAFGTDHSVADLVRLLDDYMAEQAAGRQPDREKLLAEHPALAGQLERCLAGIEFVHAAAATEGGTPGYTTPGTLGDFRLIDEIGRGGMGVVYEAEQLSLKRKVALKVLRFGSAADPEAMRRFQGEAETVARLHHTNIVPIFAVGCQEGVHYYAMQFIEGRGLDAVLEESRRRREAISAEEVAGWGLQAAEALTHAHQRGVIHRDIKPSNLLLDTEGTLWLTDFGLAKRQDEVTQTVAGALLGTPRYMSPEQAAAVDRPVDHRTDVYSLGATLYELATGKPIFEADTPHGVISQILSVEPEPPRSHRPDLPRDLETILLKCLAKDPSERYPTTKDLADDLRAFSEGRPIWARRPNLIERSARWLRRQKRSVALTAAAVAATLLVVIGGSLGWYGYSRWRLAYMTLTPDTPPLVAEILDPQGEPMAPPVTVPTQQPVELPAGEAHLRISGEGVPSQTYRTTLQRGTRPEFDLDLDDQLLRHPLELERSFRLVDFHGGTDVLLLEETGVRRLDGSSERTEWSLELARADDGLFSAAPGWVWPWDGAGGLQYSGYGKFDLRPWATSAMGDLDGDAQADVVLAARHQAWLLALSGADGRPLWLAARGSEVRQKPDECGRPNRYDVASATLGPPQPAGDLDGDGVTDMVATFVDAGASPDPWQGKAARWVEAISGAGGETIWRYDLPDECFELADGAEIPYAFRFFTSGGGRTSSSGRLRNDPVHERLGHHVYVPDPARVVSTGHGPLAVLAAGKRLVGIDLRSGKPAWDAAPPDVVAGLQVRWADVDADGTPDAILTERVGPGSGKTVSRIKNGRRSLVTVRTIPGPGQGRLARLAVWSPVGGKLLWKRDVAAYWPRRPEWQIPAPDWPLVADIDGNGRRELIVPNGMSGTGLASSLERIGWGELEVLDAVTGSSRWKRRLMTGDGELNHFLVGPDLDADGHREIFAAALWGPKWEVYVDALSGRDGRSLWTSRRALVTRPLDSSQFWLGPLSWWQVGNDGWQQLIVPVHPTHGSRGTPQVLMFSAGTGELTRMARGVEVARPADADGDGVEDLFTFRRRSSRRVFDHGGRLVMIAGVVEYWRHLGPLWQPAADFDADGVRDLVEITHDKTGKAVSGRSGNTLWESSALKTDHFSGPGPIQTTGAPLWRGDHPQPAGRPVADLDGDDTPDLLVATRRGMRDRKLSPLTAISGRTGGKLWSADLAASVINGTQFLDARDLDGDLRPEVVMVVAMNWDYPKTNSVGSLDGQLWLIVFSGDDGRVRWKHPLTAAYGRRTKPSPYRFDRLRVEIPYGDLDGDGVLDLVLPAETPGGPDRLEIRAVRGADGSQLWAHRLPQVQRSSDPLGNVPPATVADLDADGKAEVAVLAWEDVTNNDGRRQRTAHLWALGGKSAGQKWHWQAPVDPDCGRIGGGQRDVELRPRPLLLRSGDRYLVCLNLWDRPQRLVLIDHAGRSVQDVSLPRPSNQPREFRVWACDTDGEGDDEIVLVGGEELMAVRPSEPKVPLWRRAVKPPGYEQVVGVLPGAGGRNSVVVLWGSAGRSRFVGVDAATGGLRWTCDGPVPPRIDEGGRKRLRSRELLAAGDRRTPPVAFFRYGYTSVARQGVPSARQGFHPVISAAASREDVVGAAAPRLRPVRYDPRLLRPLPWKPYWSEHTSSLLLLPAWSVFFCATLLVLPLGFAAWLLRRRRWGLRTMLLLPVVAAATLLGVTVEGPRYDLSSLVERLMVAVGTLPALAFVGLMVYWSVRRRWRRVAGWTALATVVATALAVVLLVLVRFSPEGRLGPGERWDPAGWYWIWLLGAYFTGCVMLLVLLSSSALRAVWSRVHTKARRQKEETV